MSKAATQNLAEGISKDILFGSQSRKVKLPVTKDQDVVDSVRKTEASSSRVLHSLARMEYRLPDVPFNLNDCNFLKCQSSTSSS